MLSLFFLCSFEETDDFFRYEINENGEAVIIAFAGEMFSTNVTVPEEIEGHTVTTIAESAFYSHQHIKKITIPNTVTKIEYASFGYCQKLNEIIIKDGDTPLHIGLQAFEGCSLLTSIDFGTRPITIDDMAFENCIRLGSIDINDNIQSIGYDAFKGCESLVLNITNNPDADEYAKNNFIATSVYQTDRFKISVGLSIAGVILIGIFVFVKIRKNHKSSKKSK